MEKKRTELDVVITAVTSPNRIAAIAEEQAINPQEVFVRINFKVGEKEFTSSNKLRFLGQEGYQKLLDAKESGDPVKITLTMNDKGSLFYLANDMHVEVADLFSTPVERVDNRASIADLF